MQKTLIIKETKTSLIFRVEVITANGRGVKEVARFANSGMGWVALGAAGRYLLEHMMFDFIQFQGNQPTYEKLVGLGIIIR